MKKYALTVLLSLLLLSAAILPSYAQTLPASQPPSREEYQNSNLDLAIVKAQMLAYKQALIDVTKERDSLKSQLDSHSIDSAQQSEEQKQEVAKQTKRLDDLNNTITKLESGLATAATNYQATLDKTDKDHKAEVQRYQTGIIIRDVIIGVLVLIAIDDLGHRLKVW